MEDPDGISDYEVGDEEGDQPYSPSEHEPSQTETSTEGFRPKRVTLSGNKEWEKQQKEKQEKKKTPQQRADDLTDTIRNFRIAHAGDGLLRGNFGNLIDQFKNIEHQMEQILKSVGQFQLEGDGLNVSGSFDKGFTVSRQNPCTPPQESQ